MELPDFDACLQIAEYRAGEKACRVFLPCDADPQASLRLMRCLAEIFSEENAGKCFENGEKRKKRNEVCEM